MDIRHATDDGRSEEEAQNDVPETVTLAAEGRALDPDQQDEALSWLLADEGEGEVEFTKLLQLNVGTSRAPRWVDWRIKTVDRDVLKAIQKSAGGTRAQRRAGSVEVDPGEANLRIVLFATVEPDLAEAARRRGIQESPDPMYAPLQLLRWRFREKPGLVDQIAGEVLDLSGFDDDDVRESQEVAAAKN